jgi:succinyl-CoA synthetase beta subunit
MGHRKAQAEGDKGEILKVATSGHNCREPEEADFRGKEAPSWRAITESSMKIHEFQAKEMLRSHGIQVPKGGPATSGEEAVEVARRVGNGPWVIKAQVHAGGRGKAGGILMASSLHEVGEVSSRLLGARLATVQSGPQGHLVKKVLVEEAVRVERELYAGVVVDRSEGRAVLLLSASGGVEIETLAKERPHEIVREFLEPWGELPSFRARRACFALGLDGEVRSQVEKALRGLCSLFHEEDCTLAEINPLAITKEGVVLALDAKINLDDNALFRHPSWFQLRDPEEEDLLEVEARDYGLSYVKMDGTIGCMVNGAGLAMATMDVVLQVGARPANFLDVGGGAREEVVSRAFEILLKDPKVKVILVNIFGGITRGDVLARGIVDAASKLQVHVPIVVRLEGTNAQEGHRILEESGLRIHVAKSMVEAAKLASTLGRN